MLCTHGTAGTIGTIGTELGEIMSELTVVGKPIQRVDAEEKITGQAVYGYDLVLPNMLYGKTLFSPKAHAKIRRINIAKAKTYPGVVAVVTAEDAPWTH